MLRFTTSKRWIFACHTDQRRSQRLSSYGKTGKMQSADWVQEQCSNGTVCRAHRLASSEGDRIIRVGRSSVSSAEKRVSQLFFRSPALLRSYTPSPTYQIYSAKAPSVLLHTLVTPPRHFINACSALPAGLLRVLSTTRACHTLCSTSRCSTPYTCVAVRPHGLAAMKNNFAYRTKARGIDGEVRCTTTGATCSSMCRSSIDDAKDCSRTSCHPTAAQVLPLPRFAMPKVDSEYPERKLKLVLLCGRESGHLQGSLVKEGIFPASLLKVITQGLEETSTVPASLQSGPARMRVREQVRSSLWRETSFQVALVTEAATSSSGMVPSWERILLVVPALTMSSLWYFLSIHTRFLLPLTVWAA